jgi:hypothetical protein
MELLGYMIKDNLTGIEGVATGYVTSAFSAPRYEIQPRSIKEEGKDQTVPKSLSVEATWAEAVLKGDPTKPEFKGEPWKVVEPVQPTTPKFQFFQKVKDKASEFRGTIVARVTYASGCHQYLVANEKLEKDKNICTDEWYGEGRLEAVGKAPSEEAPAKSKKDPGGPMPISTNILNKVSR